jgi:hypothetical protein
LELFGNTLFYPGMEIFIDPRSFGGSDWDPTAGGRNKSVANALGIGGYHTITKVSSKIDTSGFTTTVEAVFQYSGDSASRAVALYGQSSATPVAPIEKPTPKKDVKCVTVLNKAIERSIKLDKP